MEENEKQESNKLQLIILRIEGLVSKLKEENELLRKRIRDLEKPVYEGCNRRKEND